MGVGHSVVLARRITHVEVLLPHHDSFFPPHLHAHPHMPTVVQLAYVVLSHLAIAAHMMVVKEYGGVTAVLVGNTRKAMTMALSFILFPKVRCRLGACTQRVG